MNTVAAAANKAPLTSNELSQERTDLSIERTMMSADRTLMAWVRTSLSMTSFGFTIYKLLQSIESSGSTVAGGSPRAIGLFLTGLGAVAMVMGSIEYWYRLRRMRMLHHFSILQPSFVMGLVMSATALFLFVGIISKLL